MAFSPLPSSLVDYLHVLILKKAPVVVDLGCGDGAFSRALAPFGLSVRGLDRMSPVVGTTAEMVGDALQVPLQSGRVDLLLAGNLLRHLVAQSGDWSFLDRWCGLLKPGGRLFILEDEPGGTCAPADNYRRVQEFLAKLSANRRAPLLSLTEFRAHLEESAKPGGWTFGSTDNDIRPDTDVVLDMLRGPGETPGGEVTALMDDIRTHGLSYGRFWWAAFQSAKPGSSRSKRNPRTARHWSGKRV